MELKSNGFPKPPALVWVHNATLRTFWHCWDQLYLQDGLLVKKPDNQLSFSQYAFVIPKALISSVLQGIHSSPFSGHLGVNKSLLRARNRFYWPRMTVNIREYVSLWETCAQIKLKAHANKCSLLRLMSLLFSGQWITWVPCQKLHEGTNHGSL